MKKFLFSILFLAGSFGWLNAQIAENQLVKIAKFKGNKPAAISYTFDDGYVEHYTVAAPELEKHGFRGTFWVNGTTHQKNEQQITDTTRATWAQLKEMAERGHEISNHGWSHKNLNRITREEIIEEIRKNDSIIFLKTGVMPVTYCYAYNSKNDEAVRLASENRVGTRMFQRSIGSKSTDESLEKWVSELIERGEWGVGMTHGISYGYDAFRFPAVFWRHLEKVKAQEDIIWVGTFREIAAYEKERDCIRLDISSKRKKIKITPSHPLDKNLYTEELTMVVNTQKKKIKSVKQGKKTLPFQPVSPEKTIFDFDPNGSMVSVSFSNY